MSGSFASQVASFVVKSKKAADLITRTATLELFTSVVMDTPVDTGRAAGNWLITTGNPSTLVLDRVDPSYQQVTREIMEGTPAGGGQVTYLSNNLPYIARIEYEGWSHTKAPEGMVRKNFSRVLQMVDAAVQANKV